MAKSLTEYTLEGFYFTFGRAIGRGVIQLGVLAILARLLSIEDFGIYSAALVVITLAQVFSEMGMGPAVIQRAKLNESHIATALTSSIAIGLVVGVIVFLSAPAITAFFRIDRLTEVVLVLAALFPIMGAATVPKGLLQRKLAFRRLAALELAAYILGYAPVAIAMAYLGFGVWSLIGAHIAEIAIRTALFIRATAGQLRLGFRFSAFRDLIGYSVGFTLARLGNFVALQGDYLVVGRWLGSEALGIYGRAYQLLMMPANLFGNAVDTVLFPSMSSIQNDPTRLRRAYLRAVGVIALISLPLTGLLVLLAPEIIRLVLGAKWDAVILPFQILVTTLLFRTSYKMSDSLARATGVVYQRAWRQWIYAGAVFAGSLIGQKWGVAGVAVGVSLAIALNFFLMLHLSVRVLAGGGRELLVLHMRHALIAVLTTVSAFYAADALRMADWPHWLVIGGAGAAAGATGLAIWFFAPRLVGDEGEWLLSLARKYTRRRK